jgi:1,2-dihydroxy-3-keto-5-methylthiopentene dioxygenase
MAILHVPDQDKKITDQSKIKAFLAERGVWFDQWEAKAEFDDDADQETVLAAYEHVLKPYMDMNGYQTADVISVNPPYGQPGCHQDQVPGRAHPLRR